MTTVIIDSITVVCIGRIAYAVWLLDQIFQQKPADVELKVMYDIAFTLVLHLKARYA